MLTRDLFAVVITFLLALVYGETDSWKWNVWKSDGITDDGESIGDTEEASCELKASGGVTEVCHTQRSG